MAIGYWTKDLIPLLKDGARIAAWGGDVQVGRNGKSLQMGSWVYPKGFYDDAAYFKNVQYMTKELKPIDPSDDDQVREYI